MERFRAFEGRNVGIALQDGCRLDGCVLMGAGRHGIDGVWVYVDGDDVIIEADEVRAIWEEAPSGPLAA